MAPHQSSREDLDALAGKLRAALLEFGSHTPDNEAAMTTLGLLEGAASETDKWREGPRLCIGATKMPFDDFLYMLEDSVVESGVSQEVRDAFPGVSAQEFAAAMRVLYLLLALLTNGRYVVDEK